MYVEIQKLKIKKNKINKKNIKNMDKYIVRIIFVSDLCGKLYSRPVPDDKTRSNKGLINILNDRKSSMSSDTPEKYILKGGFPRIQTRIKEIIKYSNYDEIFIVASGSNIGGSIESFCSQGQISVKALNYLGTDNKKIECYVPGLLDYIYGQNVFNYTFNNDEYKNIESQPKWLQLAQNNNLENIKSNVLGLNLNRVTHNNNINNVGMKGNVELRKPFLLKYDIKSYNDDKIKIGIIGLTINQKYVIYGNMYGNPMEDQRFEIDGHVSKSNINQKIIDDKLIRIVRKLKGIKKCNSIILISNFGFKGNIRLAEIKELKPIDVILSSGTFEVNQYISPINKTLIVEIGGYGENVGVVKIPFIYTNNNNNGKSNNGKYIVKRKQISHKNYDVGPYVKEDKKMRKYIDKLMEDYFPEGSVLELPNSHINKQKVHGYDKFGNKIELNPNITVKRNDIFPLKSYSKTFNGLISKNIYFGLHRNNFICHQMFPAALSGTSSNLMAECIRAYTKTQFSIIRGFRNNMTVESSNNLLINKKEVFDNGYGNGELTYGDIFDSFSFTSYVGRGFMKGRKIKDILQNSIYTSLNKNIYNNIDGYVFGFSGILVVINNKSYERLINGLCIGPGEIDFDNLKIRKKYNDDISDINTYEDIDMDTYYSVGSHINFDYPNYLNNIVNDCNMDSSDPKYIPIRSHNIDSSINTNLIIDYDEYNKDDKYIDLIHPATAVYKYLNGLSEQNRKSLIYNICRYPNIYVDTILPDTNTLNN